MTGGAGIDAALVVGIGNPLRGDDGVGPAVAALVRARAHPGVQVAEVHADPDRTAGFCGRAAVGSCWSTRCARARPRGTLVALDLRRQLAAAYRHRQHPRLRAGRRGRARPCAGPAAGLASLRRSRTGHVRGGNRPVRAGARRGAAGRKASQRSGRHRRTATRIGHWSTHVEDPPFELGTFRSSDVHAAPRCLAGSLHARGRSPPRHRSGGGHDFLVLQANRIAQTRLRCPNELVVVRGAGHLFQEPGALEKVAELAGDWFLRWLPVPGGERSGQGPRTPPRQPGRVVPEARRPPTRRHQETPLDTQPLT